MRLPVGSVRRVDCAHDPASLRGSASRPSVPGGASRHRRAGTHWGRRALRDRRPPLPVGGGWALHPLRGSRLLLPRARPGNLYGRRRPQPDANAKGDLMLAVWYILVMGAQGCLFSLMFAMNFEPIRLWVGPIVIWYAIGFGGAPIIYAVKIRTTLHHKFVAAVVGVSPIAFVFFLSIAAIMGWIWEGRIDEWLVFLSAILFFPTWFMTPATITCMTNKLRGQLRTFVLATLVGFGIVGVVGWVWVATFDERVDSFTGMERIYAERALDAADDLCLPKGELTSFLETIFQSRWKITEVQILGNNRYLARMQRLLWMRIPIFSSTVYTSDSTANCRVTAI